MSSGNTITMKSINFVNNRGLSGNGGGVYISQGNTPITMANVSFVSNRVGGAGGGMYISQNNGLTLISSTFVNNQAKLSGGAI